MSKGSSIGIAVIVLIMIVLGFVIFRPSPAAVPAAPASSAPSTVLRVVAAENFWGSLALQLGGSHVQVLSVVADPNADPHEYESSAADARAVAAADYVVLNGAGYDSWMNKLVGANPNPNRKVLNVAELLGKKQGDNPHFWYDPAYVNQVVAQMERNFIALDPADAAYYQSQGAELQASLAPYQARIAAIKQQFSGEKVAATEDIFTYLANATGLNLISPQAFITAVAEGNDPPASSVMAFEDQLRSGQVKVLVYNKQTVTPLTDNMRKLAAAQGIPVVGITETIQPPTLSFEDWMSGELADIQNALMAK